MTPRLAYSSNAYMRFDVEEAIARIASLGYSGIELMADTPHLWPADVTRARIDSVQNALQRHGLAISNINAFMMNKIGDTRQPYWHPSWIETDVAYRRIRIDHTKAALTLAKRLAAPHITTEPGGPVESDGTHRTAMSLFVEMLKPVVEHAEREGVVLLIEPEPELLIERFDQYLELADRVESPYLALNFDIGHAYCVGEEPADWIPKMAAHTRHYHFEDIAATRVHEHLVPGTGAVDFAAAMQAVHATGYEGWITVELYPFVADPDAAGRDAKKHLEQIAAGL